MNGRIRTVNDIVGYIEENLSERFLVADVAAALHYSKYHLHRLFSQTTGITIHEYIKRRRLTRGAETLSSSRIPITEVAFQAGYETQQAFTAAFKAMYKQTPGQFREWGGYYPLQLEFHFKGCRFYGAGPASRMRFQVRAATAEMIPEWMALVHMIVDGFPHLNQEGYMMELKKYIAKGNALVMTGEDMLIGIMLADGRAGAIDFMGIHPFYKQSDAGSLFLRAADGIFEGNRYISITTYREGDKADTGHRKAVKRLGFQEGELLTEFGYPTQRFFRDRKDSTIG